MSKRWVIVPCAVSILLLIASFFVGGPVRGRFVSIEFTLGVFFTIWLISLIVVISLETIGIWSDKHVDRSPFGPFVVLTTLSSVETVVFEIVYFMGSKTNAFIIANALIFLLAPILFEYIWRYGQRVMEWG